MAPTGKQLMKRISKPAYFDMTPIPESLLKEEYSRMLKISGNEKTNVVRFNFHAYEYKPVTTSEAVTVLIEGSLDYIGKPEVVASPQRKQRPSESAKRDEHEEGREDAVVDDFDDWNFGENELDEDQEMLEGAAREIQPVIRNQFNFSERGSQTNVPRPRHQLMQTQPPATSTFSANSSQEIIYDAYVNVNKPVEVVVVEERELHSTYIPPKLNRIACLTEKMVIQNLLTGILLDFKYFDDPADDFRGTNGYLLPLWKFKSDTTKYLAVTDICWIPRYPDLFVITFGMSTFVKEGQGAILLYSLKKPSYPARSYFTDYAVMCVDCHWQYSNYMCAGLSDGSVYLFNLGVNSKKPVMCSERGLHSTHVSQVMWERERSNEQLNFFAVSSDGLVVRWTVGKKDLKAQVLLRLDISEFMEKAMLEMNLSTFGCGVTFDFHHNNYANYVIGTEIGHGYICSQTHSTEPLTTFNAHQSIIYKIAWNAYHPKIFITCSEDWTVKIWELTEDVPVDVFVFEIGSQVYDVEWAPYSSTVFAAATANAQLLVYDLSVDRNEPVCNQVVLQMKKTRAMHLKFNREHPVILVGDDLGEVTCLKLSPNLRRIPKDRKLHLPMDKEEKHKYEVNRFENLLSLVRDKV